MAFSRQAYRACFMAIALEVFLLGSVFAQSVGITAREPQLRAAVILGIVRFTSWPPNHNPGKNRLVVCTIGEPVAEPALLLISETRKVAEYTIIVRSMDDNGEKIGDCNVVVLGSNLDRAAYTKILQRVASLPILTICDNCFHDGYSTMVSLVRRDDRIGFQIDITKAKSQGIVFSSSLLELALEVRR